MEKVRVYVRINFASGGRQGATPEPDCESRRVFTSNGDRQPIGFRPIYLSVTQSFTAVPRTAGVRYHFDGTNTVKLSVLFGTARPQLPRFYRTVLALDSRGSMHHLNDCT